MKLCLFFPSLIFNSEDPLTVVEVDHLNLSIFKIELFKFSSPLPLFQKYILYSNINNSWILNNTNNNINIDKVAKLVYLQQQDNL